MDFKRIGPPFILSTALLGVVSIVLNIVLSGAVNHQQEPATTIVLVLRILTDLSLLILAISAIMTAVREQQLTRAIPPLLFGLLAIALELTNSEYAFSLLVATFIGSTLVFGGEKTEPLWQKNSVMTYGLLGVVAFNVGLAASVTHINSVVMIALIFGVTGFILGLISTIQRMQWGWIALLLLVAASGLLLMLISGRTDIGLLFLPMAAITAVRGIVWTNEAAGKQSFGIMAGLGVLMIIGGGSLINSVFSTVPVENHPLSKETFQAGTDMYLAAGVLCLIAWVFSFLYAARHSMWGWFATSLLLPSVGAVLLGFFGPTPEDFQQGRASAAAKRQAGA